MNDKGKNYFYRSSEKAWLLVETGKDGTGALYQTVPWQGRGPVVTRLPTTMVGTAVPQSVLGPLCHNAPQGTLRATATRLGTNQRPRASFCREGVGSRCPPVLAAPQQDVRGRRNPESDHGPRSHAREN